SWPTPPPTPPGATPGRRPPPGCAASTPTSRSGLRCPVADELVTPERLDELTKLIETWLDVQLVENPTVAAVDRDPTARRWFVRMSGEEKATFTLWLTLGQRTLQFETYVMPAPEENHGLF